MLPWGNSVWAKTWRMTRNGLERFAERVGHVGGAQRWSVFQVKEHHGQRASGKWPNTGVGRNWQKVAGVWSPEAKGQGGMKWDRSQLHSNRIKWQYFPLLLNYLWSIWFCLFLTILPRESPFNHLLGIISNTSCKITVLVNTWKILGAI